MKEVSSQESEWPDLLEQLLARFGDVESLEIELKSAQGGLPASLWPTVSAFANTNGGWIILGATERRGRVLFEGVPNPSVLVTNFFNLLRNRQKISLPVCQDEDVSVERAGRDGEWIVVIRVLAAPRGARPVYLNANPYSGTYIRRHAGDYQCTPQEVNRMIREAGVESTDGEVLTDHGIDDLDADSIQGYRNRVQVRDPASPWNRYSVEQFLDAIGAYRHERKPSSSGVTVAGLLMFGKPGPIQNWRTRHIIDFQRLSANPRPERRWEDRLVWEGNLLGAFEAIYPKLVSGLATPFQLDREVRREEGNEQTVLREALVNLLVHADYNETQSSLIQRSPEGYLFRNPGNSRVSMFDLLHADRSDPRNPRLVRMFRLAGLAEEAGQGIPTIRSLWRSLGFQQPSIDVGTERYEFAIRLRYAHLISDSDRAWLRGFGLHFTENQQMALVMARHGELVSNANLCELTGLHPADVTKELRELRQSGFLEMENAGRWATYRLGEVARQADDRLIDSFVHANPDEALSVGTSGMVHPSPVSLQDKEPSPTDSLHDSGEQEDDRQSNLQDKGPESPGSLQDSSPNAEFGRPSLQGRRLTDDAPDSSVPSLLALANAARSSPRLPPEQLDDVIEQLCRVWPLSVRQLAELTDRARVYIRTRVTHLVKIGRLKPLYPRTPNHPRQRYLARDLDR